MVFSFSRIPLCAGIVTEGSGPGCPDTNAPARRPGIAAEIRRFANARTMQNREDARIYDSERTVSRLLGLPGDHHHPKPGKRSFAIISVRSYRSISLPFPQSGCESCSYSL